MDNLIKDIVYVDIDELKFAEYNPRKISKKQYNDLKNSIVKFGFVDPIIVNKAENRKNIIIGGHFRVKIAKDLGYKKVPCVFVDIPDIEKEKELNLRLNKNTGDWDFDFLKNFDFDLLKDVGFDEEELDEIFGLETTEDNFDVEKELEKIQEPKTKYGDLYQLGKHRLLCGDATKEEDMAKLMNGEKADMVFTDPPYNIGLDYSRKITSKKKYTKQKMFSDNKSDKEYSEFLEKTLKNILLYTKEDCHIFFWCDEKYIWLFQTLYSKYNIKNKRVCLWIKDNFTPTPQCAFNKVYEPCIYGTKGKPKLNNRKKELTEILNKNIQKMDDLIDYFNINIWLEERENTSKYKHTTQKPVTLAEKPLLRCSFINNIVLDTFGGSGSTLIACEQLQRRCYMMEIDPYYCDVIISRWEQFTKKKAQKIN